MATLLSSVKGPLEKDVAHIVSETLPSLCHHSLYQETFAPCIGCFGCWVRHPGSCRAKDEANQVMRDIMKHDTLIWLVQPRWGCWDTLSKMALDKTIGLISPFFENLQGETHHHKRYKAYPRWVVLAVGDRSSDQERQRFETLVQRNTLNMHSTSAHVIWIDLMTDWQNQLRQSLRTPSTETPEQSFQALHPLKTTQTWDVSNKTVTILIGSAKPPGTSSSESLGHALLSRLEKCGWKTHTFHVASIAQIRNPKVGGLISALQSSSLWVLSTPIYIDCLPALVIHTLQLMASKLKVQSSKPALFPIVQCGFPETTHTRLGIEILFEYAKQTELPWAGHWAMGCGGFLGGQNLDEHKRFHGLTKLMDQAAHALQKGESIPHSVTEELNQPIMNPMLYRWMGQMGWIVESIRNHSMTRLWDRPFDRT